VAAFLFRDQTRSDGPVHDCHCYHYWCEMAASSLCITNSLSLNNKLLTRQKNLTILDLPYQSFWNSKIFFPHKKPCSLLTLFSKAIFETKHSHFGFFSENSTKKSLTISFSQSESSLISLKITMSVRESQILK